MVLLAVFLIGPILTAFYGSFTDMALRGTAAEHARWVGLRNYTDLFSRPDFANSVLLTVVFVLFTVAGENVIGMVLALATRNGNRVVAAIVGTIVIGAFALPEIVSAFAAYAFFSKDGTLNALLSMAGITGPSWLFSYPMLTVITTTVWRGTAFAMLIYSAALQEVPEEITEAAEVDGASASKTFFLVTLPLLAYQEAFQFFQLGYGTAIATILLLIGALFAIAYVRVLRPKAD